VTQVERAVHGAGRPLVSVLTPTITGREELLVECKASVAAQTLGNHEHLVLLDRKRKGCAWTMNRLAEQAQGTWLLPLADDDLILPGGLVAWLSAAEGADVVYGPPLVWGETPEQFAGDPPIIGAMALIRRTVWETAGGYNEARDHQEDRDLWERLLQMNARFVRMDDRPTSVYRFWFIGAGQPGNKSRHGPLPPEPAPLTGARITDPGTTLG
jgi:glycosyltransferase involved in cell wall biosynthesis